MKNVARQKKVPVVDMTALTKEFVEDLGVDATIQQIYLPTDGTHTQATGAACYTRIVAHDLVHQGILSKYIDSEVPMVLNPTLLDFGTIYIGNESTFKQQIGKYRVLRQNNRIRGGENNFENRKVDFYKDLDKKYKGNNLKSCTFAA